MIISLSKLLASAISFFTTLIITVVKLSANLACAILDITLGLIGSLFQNIFGIISKVLPRFFAEIVATIFTMLYAIALATIELIEAIIEIIEGLVISVTTAIGEIVYYLFPFVLGSICGIITYDYFNATDHLNIPMVVCLSAILVLANNIIDFIKDHIYF